MLSLLFDIFGILLKATLIVGGIILKIIGVLALIIVAIVIIFSLRRINQ